VVILRPGFVFTRAVVADGALSFPPKQPRKWRSRLTLRHSKNFDLGRCWRAIFLVHAKIFYVHVAAQPRVEQQIPSWMMIVIVNVDAIAIPFPIAAAIQVVGSHYPV
jgi:hypothetical protein